MKKMMARLIVAGAMWMGCATADAAVIVVRPSKPCSQKQVVIVQKPKPRPKPTKVIVVPKPEKSKSLFDIDIDLF